MTAMGTRGKGILHSYIGSILLYVAFVALFCFLLFKNRDSVNVLSLSNLHYFSLMLAFTFVNVGFRGLINIITFSFGEKKIRLWDGHKLAAINTMGNYLPLSAGLLAKGFLLKNKFNITYSSYAPISVYTLITAFVVSGFWGLYSTLVIQSNSYILLLGFSAMLLTGIFIFVPIPRLLFITKHLSMAHMLESRLFFQHIVLKIMIIYVIHLLIATLRLSYSFLILGHDVPFINVLLLNSAGILTRLITLTPGAIGVREGLIATLAYLTGVDYQVAIIAVGIDRLAEVISVFGTGGIIFLREKLRIRKSPPQI